MILLLIGDKSVLALPGATIWTAAAAGRTGGGPAADRRRRHAGQPGAEFHHRGGRSAGPAVVLSRPDRKALGSNQRFWQVQENFIANEQ